MAQRRIIIDINPTIERTKFDVTITDQDGEQPNERMTRGGVHDLAQQAINRAFDSLE